MNIFNRKTFILCLCLASVMSVHASDAVTSLKAYAKFKAGNYAEARQIWQALADKGNTTAMINLANLFQQGMGVTEDQRKAFDYVQKAAELGDSRAQYELGIEYEKGILVQRNMTHAANWLKLSAQQDNPDAQYAYGILLATASNEDFNQSTLYQLQDAIPWLEKAVTNGHPDAHVYIKALQQRIQSLK